MWIRIRIRNTTCTHSQSPELELLLILTGCLTPFSGEKVLVRVVCRYTKEGGRFPSLNTGGLASFGVYLMSKTGGRRNLFITRASGTSCYQQLLSPFSLPSYSLLLDFNPFLTTASGKETWARSLLDCSGANLFIHQCVADLVYPGA